MSDEPNDRQNDEDQGTLSVEDDPDGTTDPADLAGTAGPDDADRADTPSTSEADED
jgi:hypothetical protein